MMAVLTVAVSLVFAQLSGPPSLQRLASISGVITDTTGRGLPGAHVTVASADGERQDAVTDFAGRYSAGALRPGAYIVEASMAGFDTRLTRLLVPAGGDAVWGGVLLVAPPLGGMSIERQVARLTGSDARDCGRYADPVSESALQRSVACAVTSAKARQSFSVIVQFTAGPTHGGEGLLAASDGIVYLLEYGKAQTSLRLRPCASPHVTQSHFTCLR